MDRLSDFVESVLSSGAKGSDNQLRRFRRLVSVFGCGEESGDGEEGLDDDDGEPD